MPEVNIKVKWPNDRISTIYSPSTVVNKYFSKGDFIEVTCFVEECTKALEHASKRVEQRYGFACSSAMQSLESVKQVAAEMGAMGSVEILEMS